VRTTFRRLAAVAAGTVALPIIAIGIVAGAASAAPGPIGDASVVPPSWTEPPTMCIRSVDIADESNPEGTRTGANDAIYSYLTFAITSTGCAFGGTIEYQTLAGTATTGSDFVAKSGTLTFATGSLSTRYISVQVRRDGAPGGDETVYLWLRDASALIDITDSLGRGTIVNDDFSCGPPPGLPPYLHPDYHCSE